MATNGALIDKNDIPAIFIMVKGFAILFVISAFLSGLQWFYQVVIDLEMIYILSLTVILFLGISIFITRKLSPRSSSISKEDTFTLTGNKQQLIEISNPYRGVFICSGAGGGKSKSIIEPILRQSVHKGFSGIVYDFKFPTLTNEVIHAYSELKKYSVRPVILNFDNPRQSFRVNPLAYMPDGLYALEYAEALFSNINPETIKNPNFWSRSSIALLAGGIWYLYNVHKEICTLPHVIRLLLWHDPEELINKISEHKESATLISSIRSGLKSDKQTAGVFSSLQNALIPLTNNNISYVLSGNDFDLDLNSPKDPKLLLIGSNPTIQKSISPVISLIITSAIKFMNQQKKKKSVLVLDEAPTLYIPGLYNLPAVARSNKISTIFCAQDYSQIENMYGSKKAEIILSNLANQFWGSTTNQTTAYKMIHKFGKEDVKMISETRGKSTRFGESSYSRSRSSSFQLRDRISMIDINSMLPGEFYCQTVESKQNEFMKIRLSEQEGANSNYVQDFKLISDGELQEVSDKIDSDIQNLFS